MATTRQFKSGNSQAVRIPADIAYRDSGLDLTITRLGDVITIYPKRTGLKDAFDQLRALPKPSTPIRREPIEVPDRDWD